MEKCRQFCWGRLPTRRQRQVNGVIFKRAITPTLFPTPSIQFKIATFRRPSKNSLQISIVTPMANNFKTSDTLHLNRLGAGVMQQINSKIEEITTTRQAIAELVLLAIRVISIRRLSLTQVCTEGVQVRSLVGNRNRPPQTCQIKRA